MRKGRNADDKNIWLKSGKGLRKVKTAFCKLKLWKKVELAISSVRSGEVKGGEVNNGQNYWNFSPSPSPSWLWLSQNPHFLNLIFHLLLQCKNLHRGFACVRYTCRSRYICYHFIFIQILWQRTGGLNLKAGNQMKPFAKEPSCSFNNSIIIVIAAVRCC